MKPEIVHVAEIKLDESSGMGRIACHWRDAFTRRGYRFTHIGPDEVPTFGHGSLWTRHALQHCQKAKGDRLFLVHEPGSGVFRKMNSPFVVFSHGVEGKYARVVNSHSRPSVKAALKLLVTSQLWKLRQWQTDSGLTHADALLVSSHDDLDYCMAQYQRKKEDVFVFRNGVLPTNIGPRKPDGPVQILFMATWIPRKGISCLISAIPRVALEFPDVRWCLAGTGVAREEVLSNFPELCRHLIDVVPRFQRDEEIKMLSQASLFVLPSLAEGQPLSLLQAMEAGLCCITTDCCGQKDVIEHGRNGLLFPVGDADRFHNLLIECLRDPARRMKLGEQAHQTVKDRTWASVSDEVVNRVEEVLQKRSLAKGRLENSAASSL